MADKAGISTVQKVDMVIEHISDCILELNNGSHQSDRIPEMAGALAELIQARGCGKQLRAGTGEQCPYCGHS